MSIFLINLIFFVLFLSYIYIYTLFGRKWKDKNREERQKIKTVQKCLPATCNNLSSERNKEWKKKYNSKKDWKLTK